MVLVVVVDDGQTMNMGHIHFCELFGPGWDFLRIDQKTNSSTEFLSDLVIENESEERQQEKESPIIV
jgi:hypothetical protein